MKTGPCAQPGCPRPEATRGLCRPHYDVAKKLVASGATTWSELESMGKCRPAAKVRTVVSNDLLKDFFSEEELKKRLENAVVPPPKPPAYKVTLPKPPKPPDTPMGGGPTLL